MSEFAKCFLLSIAFLVLAATALWVGAWLMSLVPADHWVGVPLALTCGFFAVVGLLAGVGFFIQASEEAHKDDDAGKASK